MSKLSRNLSVTAKTMLTVIATLATQKKSRGPQPQQAADTANVVTRNSYTTTIKMIRNIGRITELARNKNVKQHKGKEDRRPVR